MVNDDCAAAPGTSGDRPTRSRTSDFSRIAENYDSTRTLPEKTLMACFQRLMGAGVLPAHGTILDAGCGTGQASLPLAALGYQILGIDVSPTMAALAQSKVRPGWRADYRVGDVRCIDAEDDSFDAAVVSKLFQHVEDWRQACRELTRVVRPGACIVQVNERGAFGNAVRRTFTRRANECGFGSQYVGLNPHADGDAELVSFMRSLGCVLPVVELPHLHWETSISFGEALARLQERLFAEFWYLPHSIYQELLASTRAWIEAQPEGSDTVQRLTPYLDVKIFRICRAGAPG
jgi:SAM-dependent methyltransferase